MLNHLKQLQPWNEVSTKQYNLLVSRLNQLSNMTAANGIRLIKGKTGIHFIGSEAETVTQWKWMEIVQAPLYADAESEDYPDGISYYLGRFVDDDYSLWVQNVIYHTGDTIKIVDDSITPTLDRAYKALKDHTSYPVTKPYFGANWEEYWEVIDVNLYLIGTEEDEGYPNVDVRNYIPWYEIGEIVPVIYKADDKKYYIWQTFTRVGEETARSLEWNKDYNRAMAVYR